jgi:glutathione S-transferase
MILIGQFDSPFVRRVGIALSLYGIAVEHRPWSTFGDGDALAAFNPLRRVPTLVLDDGFVVIESAAILDCLDEMAGAERALLPRSGAERRAALKICALGSGLADKAVSLVYERALHETVSTGWVERCSGQIRAVLAALDGLLGTKPWFGGTMGHADVMVACALRFLTEAHPGVFAVPAGLLAFSGRCEALEPFKAVYQRFIPPA